MMDRVAVLVDAGYLFAQGSALLAGSKRKRQDLSLDVSAAVSLLNDLATQKSGLPVLRVYWYDGARLGPSAEQIALAHHDGVKLRLGFVNNVGEQKGVDSLIVTDLIELARNRAICDALLLSGDEDVRVGVQVAQSLGVRLHLVGIAPCRGSQSLQLMQEADTTCELGREVVERFLRVKDSSVAPPAPLVEADRTSGENPITVSPSSMSAEVQRTLELVADKLSGELDESEIDVLYVHFETQTAVPSEYDGKLLARARTALGRTLAGKECRDLRGAFVTSVRRAHVPAKSVPPAEL